MLFTPGPLRDLAERIRTPDRPRLPQEAPTAHEVFISYAHHDAEQAKAVCDALEQSEVRCWMAPRDVPSGAPYAQALVDAIAASKVVVLLFSRTANRSEAVLNELELAFNRGKPILPIRLEPIEPSGSSEYYLRRRQWFDANTDFEQRLTELPGAVGDALAAAATRAKPARRLKRAVAEEVPDRGLIAGRDRERAIVGDMLKRAREGHGGVIVAIGEPGIGKTRILQAALDDARTAGFQTAFVTNFEHARTPLGPWIDVLRALEPFLPELVPTGAADRIAYQRLLGTADENAGPAPDGRRLLVLVAEALQRGAKRSPIFIAFDDAQWSDPESIELLDVLIPRLAAARIAIVVGRRSAETGAASLALAALERYPAVQTLAVEAMSEAAIRQLIVALSPRDNAMPSTVVEEICRRSDGNPLFAAELARDATTRGDRELLPESVQLSVVNRLAGLPADEARILEIAAVIGRMFDLDELASIAQTNRSAVIRALRDAREAGLIRDAGTGAFAFRHELVRAAVYEHAFSAERAETHRAVAELLASRADAPAALLAYHWSRAGDSARASRYAIEAGDQAMRLNAYATARDSYIEALGAATASGVEAAELEEKTATAYDALGAANDAAKYFQSSAARFRAARDLQHATRLELRFAANAYRAGRAKEVEDAGERVLAESADPEVLYGAHAILASFYSTRGEATLVQQHIDAAEALNVQGQVRDALSIAWARAVTATADDDTWLSAARGAVELAETRGTPALHALNLVNFAVVARIHGRDGPETDGALTRAVEIADANGATYTAAYARCEQALALSFRGELKAAHRAVLEAVSLHVEAVVVRIFLAAIGLDILAALGFVEHFPAFRDPALLDAAFATGEAVRFAPLAAAHVHANSMVRDGTTCGPIVKRALGLIRSFDDVSRPLVTFALHGDDEDRAAIVALLPDTVLLPPEQLDRAMIEAIVAVRNDERTAPEYARRAAEAARAANVPLFEALACELLGQTAEAQSIYARIGAHGYARDGMGSVPTRRNATGKIPLTEKTGPKAKVTRGPA